MGLHDYRLFDSQAGTYEPLPAMPKAGHPMHEAKRDGRELLLYGFTSGDARQPARYLVAHWSADKAHSAGGYWTNEYEDMLTPLCWWPLDNLWPGPAPAHPDLPALRREREAKRKAYWRRFNARLAERLRAPSLLARLLPIGPRSRT